jgi:enoyl-CoA hydratase/carnithine racemase
LSHRYIELEPRAGDGVAVLRLARPDRLNALHAPMLEELLAAVRTIEADPEVRAYLLVGALRVDGRPCFSAGADLRALPHEQFEDAQLGLAVTGAIAGGRTPSIALVDGVCSTGGAELALACDLRLVGQAAQISDWHLKKLGTGLGAWGGSTRWARLIGLQRTKQLLLTGKVLDSREALEFGFAIEACASEELLARGLELGGVIAAMNPRGVAMTLAQLELAEDVSRDTAIRLAESARERFGLDHRGSDRSAGWPGKG